MTKRIKVRLTAFCILLLAIGAGYIVYPQSPAISLGSFQRSGNVQLGLDLQGGSQLLYQADVSQVAEADRQAAVDGVRDVIEQRINAFGVGEPVIQTVRSGQDFRLNIELPGITDVQEAVKRIGETPLLEFKTEAEPVVYTEEQVAAIRKRNETSKATANDVLKQARSGADFETLARTYSEDPGSKESGGVLPEAEEGSYVEPFNEVVFEKATVGEVYPELVETDFGYHIIRLDSRIDPPASDESTTGTDAAAEATVQAKKATAHHILLRKESEEPVNTGQNYIATNLTGKQLDNASVVFDPTTGLPTVSLNFDSEGAALFAQITKDNIDKTIAIYLDGEVISAPTVNQEISTGEAIISGDFGLEEAKELAQRLNAGALPVPISLISQQQVGPTLGQESIERSLFAGIIGLIALSIFMIVYYRLPGLLAIIALGFYSLLVLVIFKLMPVTLTLAGIAGFVLSIGMAVDANVLIFERMKEELKKGKSVKHAIDDGFSRAWLSIRDSNASSLITCLILYWFGSSIIRGFAITLAIGIIVSIFTAVNVSRILLLMTRIDKPWLYGLPKKTDG
jgi:protein-export membrane protein SecD